MGRLGLQSMTERLRKADSGPASLDPFGGYFDPTDPTDPIREGLVPEGLGRGGLVPEGLDPARSQPWFGLLGWGVPAGLYTYQRTLEGRSGARVRVEGRTLLMMSSYDYLGLIGHPRIEAAAHEAIRAYGTGTGGVRLLTGTNGLHHDLEERFAAFKGAEAAIAFSSGYLANVGVVAALVGPRDWVVADERVHRSLLDGCRLARARLRTFRHNDPAAAEEALSHRPAGTRVLVIVEGLYSMDGDVCPLPAFVAIKKRHGALLLVDEAHSLGVLGATGRGLHEHFGVDGREVDLWVASLSKAIPSVGGAVAGSRGMMIYLQHEAAPFMFSAALCPAATAASSAALEVIRDETWRVERVRANAGALRRRLRDRGFDTAESRGPIVPVILGDERRAWALARRLHDSGIYATAVVHPAVPRGSARLRLCAMVSHAAEDYDEAVEALVRAARA
jgi:8-amino-7-oxononanoate synthase